MPSECRCDRHVCFPVLGVLADRNFKMRFIDLLDRFLAGAGAGGDEEFHSSFSTAFTHGGIPATFILYETCSPLFVLCTKPASCSRRRCFDAAATVIFKCLAASLTVRDLPSWSSLRRCRRFAFASALSGSSRGWWEGMG